MTCRENEWEPCRNIPDTLIWVAGVNSALVFLVQKCRKTGKLAEILLNMGQAACRLLPHVVFGLALVSRPPMRDNLLNLVAHWRVARKLSVNCPPWIERSRGVVDFQLEEIRVDRGIISLLMVQK